MRRAVQSAEATGPPEAAPAQDTAFLRTLDGLPYGTAAEGRVIRLVAVGQGNMIALLAARMAVP